MRIASCNLRYDNASDKDNSWEFRAPAMRRLWEQLDADLIGIQEGLPHQVQDLRDWFPQYSVLGVGRNKDGSGERVALFYKRELLRCVDYGNFWLSDTPNVPGSRSFGNNVVRMATWASLLTPTDRTLLVLNTHLDHESETARRRSAGLILHFLQSCPEHHGQVITGDFNAEPSSSTVRSFSEVYVDALASVGASGKTFHGFTGVGRARIDYIFVSPSLNVRGGAVASQAHFGVYPSDHFPVYADVYFDDCSAG